MVFENVKKNFGFGCMRLPMIGNEVDIEQTKNMVDEFIASGFNYFDTAHGYLNGKSELALKECLTKRHPRENYILTNKLTGTFFNKNGDILPFFNSQLEACGVEYFDYYLMHAQNKTLFEKFKKCKAYETAFELKKQGKVKHVGLSFHDKPEVLDQILTIYPEIEVVQIQFNYLDYDSPAIDSKGCYDICVKHNKPIIVMEPVRGGILANLPDDARQIVKELNSGSSASLAIRYAASFPQVKMVLSGMSTLEQMQDNLSYMKDFKRLTQKEYDAIEKIKGIFKLKDLIPCTACKYCVAGCPMKIAIPDLFACLNNNMYKDWNSKLYYNTITQNTGKASSCLKCGKCESVCPQNLKIRELLERVAGVFENK